MPLQTHACLGPYEILAPIGAGGMGEVYKAHDTRLNRIVAIKVLSDHDSAAQAIRQRFEREGCAISRLNHPHICRLFDVGEQDGMHYLVMEYLEGETLAEKLRSGPLPQSLALTYAMQIISALDRAHRSGMVHRDVKPGNVMLTRDGAKLLDFGLVKVAPPAPSAAGATASATKTTPLTAEGTIVGTMAYMAPEQLERREADARTDLFAFGAVLYEMLTGRQAFEGNSQASLIAAIMSAEPPPVSKLQPAASPALDLVVRSCLAKDPDQRWQSAHDVLIQLQSIIHGASLESTLAPGQTRRKFRERMWQALAAIAAAAAIWTGIVHFRQSDSPAAFPMRFTVPMPADFSFGPTDYPVISPDGRRLCFCGTAKDGRQVLWVHSLDSSTTQPISGTDKCTSPFWSNDGRTIGFFAENQLKRVDVAGGAVLTICQLDAPGTGGAWNAGNEIVFSMQGRLHRVSASGGTPLPILPVDQARGETRHSLPLLLPDGRTFLYLAYTGQAGDASLFAGSLEGTQPRMLTQGPLALGGYAAGYLLYTQRDTLIAQRLDAGSLEFAGDAQPVARGIGWLGRRSWISVSNNGMLVYRPATSSNKDIVFYNREGRRTGTAGQSRNYIGLKISPDNNRLLLTVGDERSATRSDVWLLEIGTGILSRMTSAQRNNEDAVWSPDGKQFVFGSRNPILSGLYRKTIGSADEEPVFTPSENIHSEEWLRGDSVLYITQGGKKIARVSVSGERKESILLENQFTKDGPRVSPDGQWIAYTSDEAGEWQIYIASFPAFQQRRQVSTTGGVQARWNRNGRELFYLTPDGNMMAVSIKADRNEIATGVPKALFSTRMQVSHNEDEYAVTSDGQRFMVIEPAGEIAQQIHVTLNWAAGLPK